MAAADIAADGTYQDALVRAAVYRFLAAAFLYPRPDSLGRLRRFLPSSDTTGPCHPGSVDELAEALQDVRRSLGSATETSLETDYLSSFGHTVPESYPPHETRYGSSHAFQESQDLSDVAAFYEAFGLRVSRGTGERVDHVAIELEFLYLLALKEAYARERDDAAGAAQCLAATRRFFEDHIGRWGVVFAALLARKAPAPLTRSLGALLGASLRADTRRLDVSPHPVSPEPVPLPPEPAPDEPAMIEGDATPGRQGPCG